MIKQMVYEQRKEERGRLGGRREKGERNGGKEGGRKKLPNCFVGNSLNGVKIEAEHKYIDEFHVGNDFALDKGWLSG